MYGGLIVYSAKVFKISEDDKGNRLTHLKITGGSLSVKDVITIKGKEEKVNEMLTKDSWIIDGNFLNNASNRFSECDTVFFLDLNRFICMRSVIKRHKQYKGKHRDSRSDYCDEKLSKVISKKEKKIKKFLHQQWRWLH